MVSLRRTSTLNQEMSTTWERKNMPKRQAEQQHISWIKLLFDTLVHNNTTTTTTKKIAYTYNVHTRSNVANVRSTRTEAQKVQSIRFAEHSISLTRCSATLRMQFSKSLQLHVSLFISTDLFFSQSTETQTTLLIFDAKPFPRFVFSRFATNTHTHNRVSGIE